MNYVQRLQQTYPPGEARALYRMVMEMRFGLSQTDLMLGKDTLLSANDRNKLEEIIQRLMQKEPVQYILGQAEFCGHIFHVAPGVLIPRPETAELVQWILSTVPSPDRPFCRLLDVGTGSGCIAISLSLEGFPVTASDISPESLAIAQKNAEFLQAKIDFVSEDILHPRHNNDEKWQLIVSNPPYICEREKADMDDNVLLYEPHLALFVPNDNPLLFYRAIAEYAQSHLAPSGMLFFEINQIYGNELISMLSEMKFNDIELRQDQFGNPRFIKSVFK
jgi:release factor glutamine methyltransferase